MPRRYDIPLDVNDLVRRYVAGQSEQSLARDLGVSRTTIRARLKLAGVTPRDRSAAMYTRMGQTTADERAALALAANIARRGVPERPEAKIKRAQTIASNGDNRWTSPYETWLGQLLTERGLATEPQRAEGPYNIDLAAWPVAIEVHRLSAYPYLDARLRERAEYLMDQGWRMLYIWLGPRQPVTTLLANETVRLVKLAQSDPAAFGQHRVIRGAGQDATRTGTDRYQLA